MTSIKIKLERFTYPERAVETLSWVARGRPQVGTAPQRLQLTVVQGVALGLLQRVTGVSEHDSVVEFYKLTPTGRAVLRVVLADRANRMPCGCAKGPEVDHG